MQDRREVRCDVSLPLLGAEHFVYAYIDENHVINCKCSTAAPDERFGTIGTIVKKLLKRSSSMCYSMLNTKTNKKYYGNQYMLFDEHQNLMFLYTKYKGLYVSNDIIKQMDDDEMCKYIYTKLIPIFAGAEVHITWTDGPVIPKARYDSIDIEDFNEKLKDGSI